MNVGKWIRQVREDRSIKPADIERTSDRIAGARGSQEYYISFERLADIESGSVPSLYQIYSLAVCMKVTCKQLLRLFGIDFEKISHFGGRPMLAQVDLLPIEECEEEADPRLDFDAQISLRETYLLGPDPEHWGNVPLEIQKRLEPARFRYAVIGFKDDTMADILPPGSLVEIDQEQRHGHEQRQESRELRRYQWKSLWGRPIYLVQHVDGYSCCWCQQDGDELTLIPHPLSHQKAMHFKMPHEALIIGRVVNVWTPAQLDTMLPQSMHSYAVRTAYPEQKFGPQSAQPGFTQMFERKRNGRSIA